MAASSSAIDFPPSQTAVRVRLVDTTAVMTVRAQSFVKPVQPGHELLNLTCAAFLIDHEPSGKRVMFDLGVRKDFWNYAAVLQKRIGSIIPSLRVDRDVPEILAEKGVALDSISSVVWSHYHWDHIGDMSLFPSSTEVVVGPGFKSSPLLLPGYPNKQDSPVRSSDFQGRELREIDFAKSGLQIGGYGAFDFFGDGSFYLLGALGFISLLTICRLDVGEPILELTATTDTPGHCVGHMCGLARTTAGTDSTFLLLGGDICHFAGDLRPNPTHPIPDPVPATVLDRELREQYPSPCPCSLFTDHHPAISQGLESGDPRQTPWYKVSTHPSSAYVDPRTSQESVDKLISFEQSPAVMICLSHDQALLTFLPTLNKDPGADLNEWKSKGWKEKCRWDWLNELPRGNGRYGRRPIVEGFWRDGKPWDRSNMTGEE
ncbi:uncharacterized protein Z520_06112 [Fonsecaea multimorphosa CBS 102226]|uniref:Metallo-beta-lactamase domain-containing protein n=1 Tax=Fonsecaea multimorphosa CBS 102226 TaxID=1442371 RepID=A0A0D2KMX2_9EURO|nr:uncharacterized protein Z520_06112 [Fonsecaea multimorphosa CBS 102226]KIX98033.1 hypothetical protein Z520_06112 [Fonsecaea multimorphosa CBS 102226]OAL24401.1 hypothetical protein AYO22_05777 [Fonsecaea multimorphosa]